MRLQIKKLFDEKDFDLKFNENLTILIEENMLSSGEYKILRIIKVLSFCENNNIYLFDEPELSLSIYWQSMLRL